jgi:prophage regulatory protein
VPSQFDGAFSQQGDTMKTIIKLPEVMAITTFSRSTIYRLIEMGEFPIQIKLAERSIGWIEQEVLDYVDNCIDQREVSHKVTELVDLEVKSC